MTKASLKCVALPLRKLFTSVPWKHQILLQISLLKRNHSQRGIFANDFDTHKAPD
jgi:hypothetical protein